MANHDDPTRRQVLARGARAALALSLLACDDDAPADPTADARLSPDGAADLAPPLDAGPLDAGPDALLDATVDAAADAAVDAALPAPEFPLSKGPWTRWIDRDAVELRFEAFEDRPLAVTLIGPDGQARPVEATRQTDDVAWRWAVDSWPTADRAGAYTLHRAVLDGLTPGTWRWQVATDTGPVEGQIRRAGPAEPLRIAWVADTMWPVSETVAAALAEAEPDVILHGGDIQYRSNPGDTWNGFFQYFAAAMRRAPFHACVGNHEFETDTEISEMYLRLLAPAEVPAAGGQDFQALDLGPVRALLLNSESDLANDPAQLAWLDAELARAAEDPQVKQVIVGYHRPTYTFSQYASALTLREALHRRFVAAGVGLVLNGHVHAYERFDVDGVAYVVDGGGGAVIYDPDEDLEAVRAERPDEIPLRQAVSPSHGFTLLTVAPDGAIELERRTVLTEFTDRLRIPPRG